MSKLSSVVTQKPSSNTSAWANGPPPASPSRSPSATTPVSNRPTHSRKSSVLSPAVSVKDGVSVPRGIVPSSSSHTSSGINFGTIDVNGSSGPSAAASSATAAPPVVNGSAGTPPPSKDAQATPPTPSTKPSSTAASSTATPSPTPSNTSTAATSSAAPLKRKLDANKLFHAPAPFAPQPTPSAAPPTNPTAPPPSAAVPPYHHNAPNSSVMAANSPGQRFSTLPPLANHGGPYNHPSPQMANQQPVGGPSHLRVGPGPPTGGQRSPSVSSRPPINGAVPPPAVAVSGASQGRGPQSAAGQPPGPLTGTVPQVGSPRLGHQPPVMQHQQQQPPGLVPAPGQTPDQGSSPPQQMQMGWQQPQSGGWQPQYPQYPYMNPEWYSHMQHPQMHPHPHQPPYMQPPGTPHQPFAQSLPPAQQTPTTATMSPRTGPMPIPPPSSSTPVPHPNVPQINTTVPPSLPSTPASARPTTSLTPSAREFVPGGMGGSSPMIPSPGFPLPKKSNAIKISNPNTGEAVGLRPPDVGHTRNLSRDTAMVHESSPLRKPPIRMESKQGKNARRKRERRPKGELEAMKRKEPEGKAKKENEEREAMKAEEAERLKQAEMAKREEVERIRLEEERKRQEEEESRKRKEEAEERERKAKEEQERKERKEAEAKARAEAEEKIRKEAEERELDSLITFISPDPISINGNFGDVFIGTHSGRGEVALKRPRRTDAGYSKAFIKSFKREAAMWEKFQHPHILEYLGSFQRDGYLYYVSPLMKNGTLREYIIQQPEVNRIKLLCEAADGIRYLHAEGVVHGDIKAHNLLVGDNGQVKLCDFGLTRTSDSSTSTALKGAGTLRWQSPELLDGVSKSFESDVYAFGMTIAEVLTGDIPFSDLKVEGAVYRAVSRGMRPPKIPAKSPTGSSYKTVWTVAEACWSEVPEERISMKEALRLIQEDLISPDSGD